MECARGLGGTVDCVLWKLRVKTIFFLGSVSSTVVNKMTPCQSRGLADRPIICKQPAPSRSLYVNTCPYGRGEGEEGGCIYICISPGA